MRKLLMPFIVTLSLLACAPQNDIQRAVSIQRSTSVLVPVDIVTERVSAHLKSLGFEIDDAGGGIVRGEQVVDGQSGYATCKSIRIASKTSGESTRFRSAQAVQEDINVVARISQLNETTNVTLEPLMVGIYNNSFTGQETTAPCPSTGKLEQSILQAVNDLGPAPGTLENG